MTSLQMESTCLIDACNVATGRDTGVRDACRCCGCCFDLLLTLETAVAPQPSPRKTDLTAPTGGRRR